MDNPVRTIMDRLAIFLVWLWFRPLGKLAEVLRRLFRP